ncbi:MAG: ABC transporter permease [Kordiimonadaceae bacterium]|nr:ABC transporter permease [Kordiimonadaceae bacterium]
MFKIYFASIYRGLFRNRLFVLINILSLTVGFTASILILLFVFDELSFDKWVSNADKIVRVETTFSPIGRNPMDYAMSPGPVLPTMSEEFSKIEAGTRMFFSGGTGIVHNGTTIDEPIVYADPGIFSVFSDLLIKGNPQTALASINDVVISEDIKQKYFGDGPAIGQTLVRSNGELMRITGIMKNLPNNTHLDFDMITRLDNVIFTNYPQIMEQWKGANVFTYLKFAPDTNLNDITRRLPDMINRRAVLTGFLSALDNRRSEAITLHLVPFKDIYLWSPRQGQISDWTGHSKGPGDGQLVITMAAIAILILVIAIINYVNLSTASASKRAREVSIRKILGATRIQIITQFLIESVALTFIALLAACALIEILLPFYNQLIEKDLTLAFENNVDVGLWLLIAGLIIGIIAGLYPALYLSNFKPARILSNSAASRTATSRLRNFLVISQFSISIGLIICTSILFAQTNFATGMDLGFTKKNMVVLRNIGSNRYAEFGDTLKAELLKLPGVKSIGRSAAVPSDLFEDNTRVTFSNQAGSEPIPISELPVDPDFFNTYEITPLAGRLLEWNRGDDILKIPEEGASDSIPSANVILNMAALDKLGLGAAELAIGKSFQAPVGTRPVNFTIVGVIPDFNFNSIYEKAGSYIIYYEPGRLGAMTLRLDGTDIRGTLSAIDQTWKEIVPNVPISRSMLEDIINDAYGDDIRGGTVVMFFTLLATLIATVGLFGLSRFSTEKRTKEIGIRKVFGARVRDVVMLLIWQFTRPALLANIIAWPAAWYFMRDWLDGFAYRIELGSGYFIMASALSLIIAWSTVMFHVLRVARANPIHALRYE